MSCMQTLVIAPHFRKVLLITLLFKRIDPQDERTLDSSMDSADSVTMDLEEQRASKKPRAPPKRHQVAWQSRSPSVGNVSTSSAASGLAESEAHLTSEQELPKDPNSWWFVHSEQQPGMVLSEHLCNTSDAVESLSYNAPNWSLTRLRNSPHSKSSEKAARQQLKHAQSCVRRALLLGKDAE